MKFIFILLIVLGSIIILLLIGSIIMGFMMHKIIYGRSLITPETLESTLNSSYLKEFAPIIEKGIKYFKNIKKEEVYINSYDKLKLKGYLISSTKISNKLIIMAHGYHSCPYYDFSGVLQDYHEQGYDCLLIDQRAHEGSEGKYTTFGIKEYRDLLNWIDYACKLNPEYKIILSGISMGSSTIMYALGSDLPSNVKCAICDCGFTTPLHVAQNAIKTQYHLPPHFLSYTLSFAAFVRTGKTLSAMNTKKTLSKAKVPVLFFHGDKDTVVPIEMGYKNYEWTNSEKEIVVVQGAEHGISYLVDTPRCKTKVKEFIDKYVK